jgi:hypothetical protein
MNGVGIGNLIYNGKRYMLREGWWLEKVSAAYVARNAKVGSY